MKRLKRLMVLLTLCALLLTVTGTAFAAVTYDGTARDFIFDPVTAETPTDLFPGFQDVMPGDTVTQQLLIRNEAKKKVKVRLWLRALPTDEASKELLDKLQMRVVGPKDNVLFEAPAGETAQLTDWVKLGTLRSGGEITLTVMLDVPIELSSQLQDTAGYIQWEFRAEEIPVGSGSKTGDQTPLLILGVLCITSLLALVVLFAARRNKKKRPVSAYEPDGTIKEENKL